MDILQWRPLVLKVCKRYSGSLRVNGYEYEDGIQAGMLGLVLADKAYEEGGKWSFMSIAMMHIRREITRMIFTDVKAGTVRNKEAPLSPEMVVELSGAKRDVHLSAYEVEEFCNQLPLDERERRFFKNIVESGKMEAGRAYMQETGMTKQGMGLRRRQVVNTAACLYDEVM